MSHYKIICTSSYALDFLHRFSTGIVHSVYRKTINISLNGQLLAIQAEGSPLSPISLITNMSQEEMEELPVFKGQTIRVTEEKLLFFSGVAPAFEFPFSKAEVCDLKMPNLPDDTAGDLRRYRSGNHRRLALDRCRAR